MKTLKEQANESRAAVFPLPRPRSASAESEAIEALARAVVYLADAIRAGSNEQEPRG